MIYKEYHEVFTSRIDGVLIQFQLFFQRRYVPVISRVLHTKP